MINLRSATLNRLRERLKSAGSRPSMVIASDGGLLARQGLLPPEEAAAVQLVDPVVEAMFLMMAADGEVQEAERTVIRGAVRELSQNFIRSATLEVMLEHYADLLVKDGQPARLQSIAQRLSDDAPGSESAFVLAAAVAYADEVIEDKENDLLNEFADAFGISEERANELLDELESDWNVPE
jgi:tellurite resistance protein